MRTCLSKGVSTGTLLSPPTPSGDFAKSHDTESFTLTNGVTTTYQFDKNNRLSTLNHSNLTENLISYAYGYDKENNMTSRNDDLYGYDPRNQLTVAYLSGLISEEKFEVEDKTLMETQLDIMSQNQSETVEGSITLDHSASSLTVDYGYPYRMTSVSILPNDPDHRLSTDTMEVSTAMYNNEGYFTKLDAAVIEIDPDTGAINIKMDEPLFARFIKIHSHYNELDENGNPVSSFATFTVEGSDSVEAWAMVSGRNEFYNYDEKGNREARMLMTRGIEQELFINYQDSDMLKTAYGYWYKYDANGNLVEKGTQYKDYGNDIDVVDPTQADFIHGADAEYFRYVFDLKNRLKAVWKYNPQTQGIELVSEYLYDVDGMRVKKTSKTQEVHYIFDNSGKVLEEVDRTTSETTTYVFMKERHLARITSDETLYYGLDHLGTTILMTDETGASVWKAEVTPFGDNVAFAPGYREDLKLKYTGKDLDEDIGLYYFNARWYDASTGRFISEDPIRAGANWNIYVNNNPLNFIDPTGLDPHGMNPDEGDERGWKEPENDDDDDDKGSDPPKKEKKSPNTMEPEAQEPELLPGQEVPESALIQIILSARGSLFAGGEIGAGLVINLNDLKDSGLLLKAAIGTGVEVDVDTPLNNTIENLLNTAMSMADLSAPTSTSEIEGTYTKTTAGFVLGIEQNLDSKKITGMNVLTVGGGVYKGKATVVTVEDVVESAVNFILLPTPLHFDWK